MQDVYVLSAVRTPIGKFGGALSRKRAVELGGIVVKESISRSGVPQDLVEEVIMGNVLQAGNGQNPAGQAATLGGLRPTTRKYTVNVVCASGMLALESAARELKLSERNIVVAGGMESMSNSPFLVSSDFRWGVKQLFNKQMSFQDSMLRDGLLDAFYFEHMGVSAERTARKFGVTRKQADEFSVDSNARADLAWENGEFKAETVQVDSLQRDEGIRLTSAEDLGKLRSAFSENGILTAGNSSQLSDGASALVLATGDAVREYSLRPIAKITGYNSGSLDSRDFVETPIPCTREYLEKSNTKIGDFDLVEHNEAFSVASIIVRDQLGVDPEKFNVNGGAVAIGHPIGNSGARIVVTLINALQKRKMKTGLATVCHGGGGAHTMGVEIVE